MLHEQFVWEYPSEYVPGGSSPTRKREHDSTGEEKIDGVIRKLRRSSVHPNSKQPISRREEELRYGLETFMVNVKLECFNIQCFWFSMEIGRCFEHLVKAHL